VLEEPLKKEKVTLKIARKSRQCFLAYTEHMNRRCCHAFPSLEDHTVAKLRRLTQTGPLTHLGDCSYVMQNLSWWAKTAWEQSHRWKDAVFFF
jgi:hypothetical protein